MTTPIEALSQHRIGTLESVAADQFRISLDVEAPESTALNTGSPRPFPRVNSYLVVPTEAGAVVGIVTRLSVERAPFPKRRGLSDFDLVDLPFPHREVELVPVGTLNPAASQDGEEIVLRLDRGVNSFPSVGDPVLLPTDDQLEAIIDATRDLPGIPIGRSPIAADAEIEVNPDRLFGRHLAVLGNTGSGKSCTVAGLIRWSLEERDAAEPDRGFSRFIVLDPNGEYADAFRDLEDRVAVYKVDPEPGDDAKPLKVPAWMWNLQEWTAFARATAATQRPVLQQALRELRGGSVAAQSDTARVYREISLRARWLQQLLTASQEEREDFPHTKRIAKKMSAAAENIEELRETSEEDLEIDDNLEQLQEAFQDAVDAHTVERNGNTYYDEPWTLTQVRELHDEAISILNALGEPSSYAQVDPDAPIQFDVEELADHLQVVAAQRSSGSLSQWIGTLSMRIEMILSDPRMKAVVQPKDPPALPEFLEALVGTEDAESPDVVILDLSLIPTEIVHMMMAVLSRILFEALQRYRRDTTEPLPTTLVLEEAHTFIHRQRSDLSEHLSPEDLCRVTFNRIAREGRKFGLGLVLASQRPAELSQTVLSQCNTFMLHRLVNDRDQELVNRLVPEALGDLLRDLQSLPTRQGVLLGWAAPIPLLVEVSNLPLEHRPRSEDPAFWQAWTEGLETPPDWDAIAEDWTGVEE